MNILENNSLFLEPGSSKPRLGDNLAIEWGEKIEETEREWHDYCKGPQCDSVGIDKL